MKYEVLAVEDGDLPKGVHHVIVERPGELPLLLINGDAARCWGMMRAWEDTCEPSWRPSIVLPLQRRLDTPTRSAVGWRALASRAV